MSFLSPGMVLTFDTRLHRFDPTAFDAFIAQVLGPDTDVTIEERSNIDVEGPSFIRINGSRAEDLVAVAEAFYDRVWQSDDASEAGLLPRSVALLVQRLDSLRDELASVRESVGLFDDPTVREMIVDEAHEHQAGNPVARREDLQMRLAAMNDDLVAEVAARKEQNALTECCVLELGDRVAELEHLPAELADLLSRVDFVERTVIVLRERFMEAKRASDSRLADHDYVIEEILGPVMLAELKRRFATADQKVARIFTRLLLKQVGGDIVGDQMDWSSS